MCSQAEVYKKSVATSVLAGRVRVENGCTVRTWDCGVPIIIVIIIIIIIIIISRGLQKERCDVRARRQSQGRERLYCEDQKILVVT